jgi:hypothetical protein
VAHERQPDQALVGKQPSDKLVVVEADVRQAGLAVVARLLVDELAGAEALDEAAQLGRRDGPRRQVNVDDGDAPLLEKPERLLGLARIAPSEYLDPGICCVGYWSGS